MIRNYVLEFDQDDFYILYIVEQLEPQNRTENVEFYYDGACTDTAAQSQIRSAYIDLIKASPFSDMCTQWDTQCDEAGVSVLCSGSKK